MTVITGKGPTLNAVLSAVHGAGIDTVESTSLGEDGQTHVVSRLPSEPCKCGFFAGKQHDCEALSEMVEPLTAAQGRGEAVATALGVSPGMTDYLTTVVSLPLLENACTSEDCLLCAKRVDRFAHLQRAFGRLTAEVRRTAAIPSATARAGGQSPSVGFNVPPFYVSHDSTPTTPPTPAAMLGEALGHLSRAHAAARGAGAGEVFSSLTVDVVAELARLKREAEARG